MSPTCKNVLKNFRFRGLQIALILLVIFTQIATHSLWMKQRYNHEKIIGYVGGIMEPGNFFYFFNQAGIHYQEAQMFFNAFFSQRKDSIYELYREAIILMTVNLDSLDQVTHAGASFKDLVTDRKESKLRIAFLRHSLDSLLSQEVSSGSRFSAKDIYLPETDIQNVLASTGYDTISASEAPQGRSLLGRMGGAISGSQDVKKEEVKIDGAINPGNQVVVGSIEDQVAQVLNSTEQRFGEQISKIRHTYRACCTTTKI